MPARPRIDRFACSLTLDKQTRELGPVVVHNTVVMPQVPTSVRDRQATNAMPAHAAQELRQQLKLATGVFHVSAHKLPAPGHAFLYRCPPEAATPTAEL
jgi:hypothetical protein